MGRWRALVLILVHVAAAIHIVHWRTSGETMSPLEPSEAMEFSKQGVLNAGFVFFALMILTTLVFGRFFCGWACHLVALQDGCRWILVKMGLRPKPFRSRILMLVPVGAFYYIFLHPFVQRYTRGLGWDYIGAEYVREGFWDTFPPWHVALFTLFVTGGVIVYLLGSKGFCTYACPYGGIFGVVDRVAPGRIRVTDACEGCGHCTATCTSNVLVHKEVHDHGMVVDPGCMKCMDCVSVCPNDALYFGFGKPALGVGTAGGLKPPSRAYTWPEEITLGVLFLAAVFSFRGLFGVVPLLLSLGIGAIVAYLGICFVRLFYKRSVQIQDRVLKSGGTLRPTGMVFGVGMTAFLPFWAWSGWLSFHTSSADSGFREMHNLVLDARPRWFESGGIALDPEQVALVERTAEHVDRLPAWALPRMSHFHVEQAWLALFQGDVSEFERRLAAGLERRPGDISLLLDQARLFAGTGRVDEARGLLVNLVEQAPGLVGPRVELARLYASGRDLDGAAALLDAGLTIDPDEPLLHFNLGVLDAVAGMPERALTRFARAVELDPEYLEARGNLAGMLCQAGRFEEGIAELEQVLEQTPEDLDAWVMLARANLELQDPQGARASLERGLKVLPESPVLHAFLGQVCGSLGDGEAAERHRLRAVELSEPR